MKASIRFSNLGYGLLEAWSTCMFFTQGAAVLEEADASLSILSAAAVTGATLALALLCRRRDAVASHRIATVAASILNTAATLLVLLGHGPLVAAGGVLSGLANAWLWVSWGDVYASLDTETAEKTAIASATVQAAATALILWLPAQVRVAVLALLAPLAGLMYLHAVSALSPAPTDRADHAPLAFGRRIALRLVAALGTPIAVLYYLLDHQMPLPEPQSGLDMALVAGLLLFMVVLYAFMQFAHGFSAGSIFRVTASLVVGAVVLNALGVLGAVASAVMFALMLLCQYLLLLYAARLAGQGFGNAVFSFAVVQLVNHGAGLVGMGASLALWGTGIVAPSILGSAVPVVLVALLFGVALAIQGNSTSADGHEQPPQQEAPADLQAIVRARGLSPREAEVFELLVKGRSAPFIRDELTISLNTVNSHIKHIYTKLGVHTRQELIDLVDAEGRG